MPPPDPDSFGDADGDDGLFGRPLPPEDRLWRHPSEIAATARTAAPPPPPAVGASRWGVAMVAGLVGATLTLGVVASLGYLERPEREVIREKVVSSAIARAPLIGQPDVAELNERVQPSVVTLTTDPTGAGDTGLAAIAAVLRSDGYLLTSARAIQGQPRLYAATHDGQVLPVEIVGADLETDIAVLHAGERDDRLEPALFGAAVDVVVGQPVVAVSSAGPATDPFVSIGIISAVGLRIELGTGPVLYDMMQTDAELAPGATGGLLFDTNGTVIGIATPAPDGPVVATPADVARHVSAELVTFGEARHVWLGIEGTDLGPADAEALGEPGGAQVNEVFETSPAALAGLVPGDVITGFDGTRVTSMTDLLVQLRLRNPDEVVRLRVRRADAVLEVDAILTLRP